MCSERESSLIVEIGELINEIDALIVKAPRSKHVDGREQKKRGEGNKKRITVSDDFLSAKKLSAGFASRLNSIARRLMVRAVFRALPIVSLLHFKSDEHKRRRIRVAADLLTNSTSYETRTLIGFHMNGTINNRRLRR